MLHPILVNNTGGWCGDNYYSGNKYCFYSWIGSNSSPMPVFQTTAPGIETAYTAGDLLALANNGGPTQTMKVPDGKPSSHAGSHIYNNLTDGFFIKGTDNNYYTATAGYTSFTPTNPEMDKITTDQRGYVRDAIPNIGAYDGVTPCSNPTSGGTILQSQTVCTNQAPLPVTSSALLPGHNGIPEFKWQQSTTGGSSGFTDIGSANDTTYSPGALIQTTWFRRLSTVTCKDLWESYGISNVLTVTVGPLPEAHLRSEFDPFTEGCDTIGNLTGDGWYMINKSNPTGTTEWFIGNATVFTAYDGNPDSYLL